MGELRQNLWNFQVIKWESKLFLKFLKMCIGYDHRFENYTSKITERKTMKKSRTFLEPLVHYSSEFKTELKELAESLIFDLQQMRILPSKITLFAISSMRRDKIGRC